MNTVFVLAAKEIQDNLRNRWLISLSLIFALLAISLAWFGSVGVGSVGFSSVQHIILSLTSLSVLLIPLLALMLSYDSFVGEHQDGTLLLLLSYPMTKLQLLLAKLLAHSVILAVAITLGFGSAGLVIFLLADNIDAWHLLGHFSVFIVSAIFLGIAFIGLAYTISTTVAEKTKAASLCFFIWFSLVILFDLVLLGILILTEGKLLADFLPYLLLLNPADIFRIINLLNVDSSGQGVLLLVKDQVFSQLGLFMSLSIWITLTVLFSYWRLKRRII